MKDKNNMIVSIYVEKSLDKIQHPFMITMLSKVGIDRAYLNKIKTKYEKPTAQHHNQCATTRSVPLRSGTRQGCLLSTLFF